MFEGGGFGFGFGVGVTVHVLDAPARPAELLPAGVTARPTRLGELMPVVSRTGDEIAVELQRIQVLEARLAAYRAELVGELASRRPDSDDRQVGERGAASPDWRPGPQNEPAPGVSEFFADELAHVLNCSRTAASTLADQCLVLRGFLPGIWCALADGDLDWPRARALAAELGPVARDVEPEVLAGIEAAVLPRATQLSVPGLRAAARAELLRHDEEAAERRRRHAQRRADVTVKPRADGMAELSVFLPRPLAAAVRDTIDRYARIAKADDPSLPLGELRVSALADLVLRPWDTSRPPVTAHLTVLAPLPADADTDAGAGAAPAEVDGQPITVPQLRALLEHLEWLLPGGVRAPAGGSLDLALVDPRTGDLRATATAAQLERLVRRGCPSHPQGGCRCSVLGGPPVTDRYRPSVAQRRFVTMRDRTCRYPGCGNHAGWADLDHVVPHGEGGETSCENLCCLCRRHHRLKTFAPGWRFEMSPDGALAVTTPSGVTRTTRPPGHWAAMGYPAPSREAQLMAQVGGPPSGGGPGYEGVDPPPF
ncbi:HNH endonuclease signature motif containing protein [Blastococcus sp. TF02A_35]|uniref:HNH endonuclease signature motif containing protein n=1 Tax=Blastococcus sp. TF02A-35 TaxID=2559612 RepID=UPI0010739CC4|nr:HNH endonuclease signature motif containing protein [Blastococcus sp. TF02A_35]TFV48987.1 HNH endonuclease [Blastococcus sp. TF02A_35]